MMPVKKSENITDKIGSLTLGFLEAEHISVQKSDEHFEQELKKLDVELKQKFKEKQPSEDSVISATRRMYRQVGWEPTKYRPSSEALVRRILQDKGLYRINNLVDYGNLVSARFHLPMGLYDSDKIEGDIIIDVGKDDEFYEGISKPKITATGKIILRDNKGIFGNPTADSRRTSILDNTTHILAVFFISSAVDYKYTEQTLNNLASYYKHYSRVDVNIKILSL